MIPDQALRFYPGSTVGSVTLTVVFRLRPAGSSVFAGMAGIPDLSFVFPNGRNEGQTLEAIREAMILHLINNAIHVHWNPRSGTPEAVIRDALANLVLQPGAGTAYVSVLFDGQFGPVMVG